MSFNKKLISVAVLSAVSAGTAQAAALSQDGTGQVLLYPYYTTRGGTDTLITVVNSTNRAKAVKVRFLEGMNSKEVLDFNLYLSKYDVWTAAVTTDSSGNPVLTVSDKSCTAPIRVSGINGVHSEPFRNSLLNETGKVNGVVVTAPSSLDRAKEGYLEIIQMGDITPAATPGTALPRVRTASVGGTIQFETAVTHVAGVPADCEAVEASWNAAIFPAKTDFNTYTGGLFGAGTLINVAEGTDYSYDPVAVSAFAPAPLAHSIPGTLSPSLADGFPSSTVINSAGVDVTDSWTNSPDGTYGAGLASGTSAAAVSAILMRERVMNEYVIDPALSAGTDWVVNFPTRRFHIDDLPAVASYDYWPFRKGFLEDVSGKCEKIGLSYYDQEERSVSTGIDVSPSTTPFHQICWEVNVITFKGSNVLKSANKYDLTNMAYNSGWAWMSFANSAINDAGDPTTYAGEVAPTFEHYMVSDGGDLYRGLPTIGFAVEKFVNGNLGGVLSNYGGSYIHKYMNANVPNVVIIP
ncbi:MAG: hypothetical protein IPJ52_01395 [Rhodocyclaceae bacterium]|nr:hypothetical protein [Rhodocyclaceae bacterium]